MARTEWRLRELLQQMGIRPRQVETEAIRQGYTLGRNTVYRLIREDGPVNVNRTTLAAVISALRELSGRPIGVADILRFVEEGDDRE